MYVIVLVGMFFFFFKDQVDTLTFQNQSLRDKAKRFEEALRRSTDEQIVVSLATYTSSTNKFEIFKVSLNRLVSNLPWRESHPHPSLSFFGLMFLLVNMHASVTGSSGSIPAHWAGSEELEGGGGNEEPTDTSAGEEDLWSGESGRLKEAVPAPWHTQTHTYMYSGLQWKRVMVIMWGEWNIALLLRSTFEQAQKNVLLEERVQVLQQQNEDLMAQIQMNLAVSRYHHCNTVCNAKYSLIHAKVTPPPALSPAGSCQRRMPTCTSPSRRRAPRRKGWAGTTRSFCGGSRPVPSCPLPPLHCTAPSPPPLSPHPRSSPPHL